jgi:hypothetical protein
VRLRTSEPFKGSGRVCVTVAADNTVHSIPLRASIWPSPSLLVDKSPLKALESALNCTKTVTLRLKNESVNDAMSVVVRAACDSEECGCHGGSRPANEGGVGVCKTFTLPDFHNVSLHPRG